MKKIKIAARAVWQIIVTFYQFTCILLRVLWGSKVHVPTLSLLMLMAGLLCALTYYHSPKEHTTAIIGAYNLGYQDGVKTVVRSWNCDPDTEVYGKNLKNEISKKYDSLLTIPYTK